MARARDKTLPTSFRLTAEGKRLLAAVAEAKGINQTAVLESLIREAARREGIK
jgi:hypothetical protein